MAKTAVKSVKGRKADDIELEDEIFGIEPNVAVMHQVVTAQLAAKRSGTHSTKTRSEVRGGGAKPWKQKGTGRARAGSIRSPIWVGGGIAHGPKPRDYSQRTNKKMKRLALRSALSDRFADDKLIVVQAWDFDAPSTKEAKAVLQALKVEGRVLVVLGNEDEVAAKSFRNLPEVSLLRTDQLNPYDVLVNDYIIFTQESLPTAKAPALEPVPAKASGTDEKESDAS